MNNRGDGLSFRRMAYALAASALAGLALCQSARAAEQQPAPAPGVQPQPKTQQTPEASQSQNDPARSTAPADYVIGPGDTLSIFIYGFPEHSGTFTVRPDGKLTIPLVEDMVAVGKTSTQLARDFEVALADYLKDPKVNIIVSGATNLIGQVRVFGQVRTPRSVPFRQGMTVLDAIEAAGGLTESASPGKATITRKNAQGQEVRIKLKLKDLLYKGKQAENVPLQAGDFIFVPQTWF